MTGTEKPKRRISVRFDPAKIVELRKQRQWTQLDLAVESGLGKATVERIEIGQSVSLATAHTLCACYNVLLETVAYLSAGDSEPVFEARPRDLSYLFGDMLKELGEIIGEEEAREAMQKLFWNMQRFPFGTDKRDELFKRDRYDLDGFIAILEFRAGAIRSTLESIETGRIKLRDGKDQKDELPLEKAQKKAFEWRKTFDSVHEAHVKAIREGHLLLAHELRQQIADLLNEMYWSYQKPMIFLRGVYSSH
jgi:transcriptional regulator with XRE-family HTH domain